MRKISRAEWHELTDAAWEWNPIDVPRNEFTRGEYSCIVEQVVPLLQRGANVPEIIAHFDHFFADHFGVGPQVGCARFAETAIAWWRSVHA